jgi:hypothetical protein
MPAPGLLDAALHWPVYAAVEAGSNQVQINFGESALDRSQADSGEKSKATSGHESLMQQLEK